MYGRRFTKSLLAVFFPELKKMLGLADGTDHEISNTKPFFSLSNFVYEKRVSDLADGFRWGLSVCIMVYGAAGARCLICLYIVLFSSWFYYM